MSATLERSPALPRPEVAEAPGRSVGDGPVIVAVLLLATAVVAVTWRKWGVPEIDAGAELTTADLVKHGAVAYRDVRYFYGPLGLYSLALGFKVFGTSFTTAYVFGLAQAGGILAAFYALGRQWLRPLAAGLATATLLAIGFSGTAFNFVLPHTNSATFGILFILLMLLAMSRERLLAAGVAAGLVCLTRPEYVAIAAGCGLAYVIASWRFNSRGPALAAAARLALPAIAIPGAVLGFFAAQAGTSRLLTDNLWPTKFLHFAGFKTQQNWMPFDLPSVFGLLARAGVYLGLLGALVLAVEGWHRRTGARRLLALWPLGAVALALGMADLVLRGVRVFPGQRRAIESELHHLTIGMSWLPALALGVAAVYLYLLIKRRPSPLSGRWPVDLALVVAAAGLGLRAYNAFTTEGSYAPYYAAPLVLVLGILHQRLGDRRPTARAASLGALGLVAAGLLAYAIVGLYRHETTTVHTARGSFVTNAAAAEPLQQTLRAVDAQTRPSDRILAAPADGGIYFMADRRPALYEVMLLPGLVYGQADEAAAIAQMRREHVPLAAIGARNFSLWGTPTFGVDYDRLIGAFLQRSALSDTTYGTVAAPAAGTNPSKGFHVIRLK